MITFKVVKEQHGWAIRMGERMTMPFWSKDLAVREAMSLADAIGCHGASTEVIVEGADRSEPAQESLDRTHMAATLRASGRLRRGMIYIRAR